MSSEETTRYEWRLVHDGIGKIPNVRAKAGSFFYNNHLWIICGAGSGLGKTSEVWKFDLTNKIWSKPISQGDLPFGRDGQSGSYIGDGKFVIFGGQGFSEPNQKLGRESDSMKTKTYWKKEVFNDIWLYDCEANKWTPIYPDGLSFPMGRRGHSSIYLGKGFHNNTTLDSRNSSRGRGNNPQTHIEDDQTLHSARTHDTFAKSLSSVTQQHNGNSFAKIKSDHHQIQTSLIPENSLVIFGGAGIELSKYTEQLYNDIWVFSFDKNTWSRCETKGIEPPGTTEHQVYRNGDTMIVFGGITGPATKIGSAPISFNPSTESNSPISDIQIFNLSNCSWSMLQLFDNFGRMARINLFGFGYAADPKDPKKIYLFGGCEVVDGKFASSTKTTKYKKTYPNDVTLQLNFADNTLSPVYFQGGNHPSNRYNFINFSPLTYTDANKDQKDDKKSDSSTSSRAIRSSIHGQTEFSFEDNLMFIFGGCDIERGGYCDPQIYSLIKIRTSTASTVTGSLTGRSSAPSDWGREIQDQLPSIQQESTGILSEESVNQLPASFATFGKSIAWEEDEENFGKSSIWVNLQSKANMNSKNKQIKDPSNWDEMRLSLTPSRSERVFDSQLTHSPSRPNTNNQDRRKSPHPLASAPSMLEHSLPKSPSSPFQSQSLLRNSTSAPGLLNTAEFSVRSVNTFNRGSPYSPWHLPRVNTTTPGSRTLSPNQSLAFPNASSWFEPSTQFTKNGQSFPASPGTPSKSTRIRPKTPSLAETLAQSNSSKDINLEALAEEKMKRIAGIKNAMRPIFKHQTKVEARETFQKIFPAKYHNDT